ncbi:MAG TPA: DegT/DnrJ/EryC1/StrS family aminotransferase [Phycisphaerales bacterium]|nr:DegT/DnrJ/EryC1/StrS family aminotransferase [Phycisphaerales bacterium]
MRAEHPDSEWLRGVGANLAEWLDEPATTPTSQLTAGGAIKRGEALLSSMHGDRPTLLMPSATYALWVALRALGVGQDDEVLIPQYDWTSSLAVVLALGAKAVVVPTDPATLTIDPAQALARRTARTRALVATHLFGIPADIPALQKALPWVPIVEDCAQALGSKLDGLPVGSLADAAIFSFGPGKTIDVGELGALVLRDSDLHRHAIMESAHPIRQQLSGIVTPSPIGLSVRPHPLAAVLLCVALKHFDAGATAQDRLRTQAYLSLNHWPIHAYGSDGRREIASPYVMFEPETLTDEDLAKYATYREVADIESVRSGKPKRRRVGALRVVRDLSGVR